MEFEINRVGFLSRETKIYCEEFEMMIVNAGFYSGRGVNVVSDVKVVSRQL